MTRPRRTVISASVCQSAHTYPKLYRIPMAQPGGPGGTPPRNWVHKNTAGCAVELNTQHCAWFGSQISLITAMSFREAMSPPNHPQGLCPWPPLGDSVPQTPCAPHLQILAAPLQNSFVLYLQLWSSCVVGYVDDLTFSCSSLYTGGMSIRPTSY